MAFNNCTACSPAVVEDMRAHGFALLKRVSQQPGYLEELSGLAGLVGDSAIDDIQELDDDESIE